MEYYLSRWAANFYSRVSFRVTLNYLEWLIKIFNDTKHRAESLRQLAFLCILSTRFKRQHSCAAKCPFIATQLNSTSSWVELCRCKRALWPCVCSIGCSAGLLALQYGCLVAWRSRPFNKYSRSNTAKPKLPEGRISALYRSYGPSLNDLKSITAQLRLVSPADLHAKRHTMSANIVFVLIYRTFLSILTTDYSTVDLWCWVKYSVD